jgi:hypothetical protein
MSSTFISDLKVGTIIPSRDVMFMYCLELLSLSFMFHCRIDHLVVLSFKYSNVTPSSRIRVYLQLNLRRIKEGERGHSGSRGS